MWQAPSCPIYLFIYCCCLFFSLSLWSSVCRLATNILFVAPLVVQGRVRKVNLSRIITFYMTRICRIFLCTFLKKSDTRESVSLTWPFQGALSSLELSLTHHVPIWPKSYIQFQSSGWGATGRQLSSWHGTGVWKGAGATEGKVCRRSARTSSDSWNRTELTP